MKNIIIVANQTRYELLFGEYEAHHGSKMCCFAWLKKSMGGPSFAWPKGTDIYASYALDKTNINNRDFTGILSAIKQMYPESIGDLTGFGSDNVNIQVVK